MSVSQVLENALKDTNYSPYCLKCTGLVRMQKVTHLLWKCSCGAVHDERPEDVDYCSCGNCRQSRQ